MPAKAAMKRMTAASAPAAKKAKVDSTTEGVVEAIQQATEISETSRKMLLAGMTHALATPLDERHPMQKEIVDMIGEVLDGVQAKLNLSIQEEAAKLGEVEGRRGELQQAVERAEEVLAAAAGDVNSKSEALAHATEGTLSAKGALQEKQEEARVGDEVLVKAKETKADLERAIEQDLRAILEGTAENPMKTYKTLLSLLKDLAIDESLMSALPSVCSKKATERGSFDTMVLEQLTESLRDRVASLAKVVDDALPAAEGRAAAMQEAQAAADTAAAAQKAAGEALNVANAAKQSAEATVAAARQAAADFEPKFLQATAVRDECTKKLEDFLGYNVGCFEMLRDKAASPSATVGGA